MMEPVSTSELHHWLRQATKMAHRDLDHHPLLAPLVRPDLGVVQYGDALAALHGVHAQAEPRILAFLDKHEGPFDYRARLKLPALESDLAALGRPPLHWRRDLPAPESIGALIGILYTVEGSAQGGQVIERTIRNNVRKNAATKLPLQFFSGYGELSRERWEEFLRFADEYCPIAEYETAAVTAVLLFEAIKNHLDDALQHLGRI
jgi:heme oxygenase